MAAQRGAILFPRTQPTQTSIQRGEKMVYSFNRVFSFIFKTTKKEASGTGQHEWLTISLRYSMCAFKDRAYDNRIYSLPDWIYLLDSYLLIFLP